MGIVCHSLHHPGCDDARSRNGSAGALQLCGHRRADSRRSPAARDEALLEPVLADLAPRFADDVCRGRASVDPARAVVARPAPAGRLHDPQRASADRATRVQLVVPLVRRPRAWTIPSGTPPRSPRTASGWSRAAWPRRSSPPWYGRRTRAGCSRASISPSTGRCSRRGQVRRACAGRGTTGRRLTGRTAVGRSGATHPRTSTGSGARTRPTARSPIPRRGWRAKGGASRACWPTRRASRPITATAWSSRRRSGRRRARRK